LKAFFDADALGAWWQVAHSVTTPRAFGPYAVEWAPTDFRDEILGRLGGVFRGTVVQFQPAEGFFVTDAFWLPPDSDPIGPMALEVACAPVDGRTRVRVMQSGFEESVRWRRYYEVVGRGWARALTSLKSLLEQ
jgi:activator of Hsp90 ATPase-like protein